MILEPTRDYKLVYSILTHPAIYDQVTDDYAPSPVDFRVNDHPLARYVLVWREPNQGLLGLFCFYPHNRVCWEGHVAFLPEAPVRERWRAARALLPWLATTECCYLTAAIPAHQKHAVAFATMGVGLQVQGRFARAFRKAGRLEDLIILGAPVTPSA